MCQRKHSRWFEVYWTETLPKDSEPNQQKMWRRILFLKESTGLICTTEKFNHRLTRARKVKKKRQRILNPNLRKCNCTVLERARTWDQWGPLMHEALWLFKGLPTIPQVTWHQWELLSVETSLNVFEYVFKKLLSASLHQERLYGVWPFFSITPTWIFLCPTWFRESIKLRVILKLGSAKKNTLPYGWNVWEARERNIGVRLGSGQTCSNLSLERQNGILLVEQNI